MLWPLSLFHKDRITLGKVGLLSYCLPNWTRDTHLYCIGTSGSGKSKFLESLFVADIKAGRGCGLIDPHGDLACDAIAHMHSKTFFTKRENTKRVVYFDPASEKTTLEFNVLLSNLPPYQLANQIIEAFRRTWPQSLKEAPRFTNLLLAALLALIEARCSLIDLPDLLTDANRRATILGKVKNPYVLEFFYKRFEQWGKGLLIESVLNKVTAFSLNPHLRRCLGAKRNTLDPRRIMESGKVLIVNLGNCDDETRRLIGSLITTGIEQAAMSRADHRPHFYLYLDEFQDFCANEGSTITFAKMLSECRKKNLHVIVAHQTLGQIQDRIISALGNVGLIVVFQLDYSDAKILAHKLFVDYIGKLKAEEEAAIIQKLPRRTALVKFRTRRLVRLRTLKIRPYKISQYRLKILIEELEASNGLPTLSPFIKPTNATNHETAKALLDWEAAKFDPMSEPEWLRGKDIPESKS